MSKQLFLCHNLNGANNPVYCYHPDHLGTSNALTDANGTMYRFFLNLPFGEPRKASSPTQLNYKTNRGQTMASQSSTSYYQSEFKFNDDRACKKCPVDIFSDGASMPRWSLLDKETSLYYYGAHYYDPSLSVWLSVDPLAEEMPEWSSYTYAFNNPVKFVDPDGKKPLDWIYNSKTGKYYWDENVSSARQVKASNLEYVGKNYADVYNHFERNNNWFSKTLGDKRGGFRNEINVNSYYEPKILAVVQRMFDKHKSYYENEKINRTINGKNPIKIKDYSIERLNSFDTGRFNGSLCLDGKEYNFTVSMGYKENLSITDFGFVNEYGTIATVFSYNNGGTPEGYYFYMTNHRGGDSTQSPAFAIRFNSLSDFKEVREWYNKQIIDSR